MGVSKSAIAHVQCQVCEMAVKEASDHAKENAIRDEDGLADLVDGLCSVKQKSGRWVAMVNLFREDDDADGPIVAEKQADTGVCRNECTTVQRACTSGLKGKEDTLASLLLKGANTKELVKKVCKQTCAKPLPKLGKWVDEAFEARDAKEVETEDLIEKMRKETGMGMKMYKREDLLSMSEGDMETMAAREAFASERQASKMADSEL